jgi:formiminotetrahydrofolate cyclodeaminase
MGAALLAMVARLSIGRPKFAEHEALLVEAQATGQRLVERFLELADDDAAAYGRFARALKLPRETDEERRIRSERLGDAAIEAAEVPLACVEACVSLVEMVEALAGRSNPNASSDLTVAALLGEAAARGAAANVLVNVPSIPDQDLAGDLLARAKAGVDLIERLASTTREVVQSGDAREPLAAASA